MKNYTFVSMIACAVAIGAGTLSLPLDAEARRGQSRPAPPKEITEFVGAITSLDLKAQEMTVKGSNKMTNKTLSKPTTRTFKLSPFCRVKSEKKPFLALKNLAENMEVEVSYDEDAKAGLVAKNILVLSAVPDNPPPAQKK